MKINRVFHAKFLEIIQKIKNIYVYICFKNILTYHGIVLFYPGIRTTWYTVMCLIFPLTKGFSNFLFTCKRRFFMEGSGF